jgi:hemerythrin
MMSLEKNDTVKEGAINLDFLEQNVYIVWKPEYNLGIPIIDDQHRGIVTIINSLYFGMQNNYVHHTFVPIVEMINSYSQFHFLMEEDFYAKTGFPNLKHQQEMHRGLISELARVGKQSKEEKDPYPFMAFMKKWWIDHICSEDMLFRDFLQTLKQE